MKMNKTRLLSLLMAMLFCFVAIPLPAIAEEASTPPAETPATITPEAIPNDLLLDVDLRGTAAYTPASLKSTGGEATVSADGDSVLLVCRKTGGSRTSHLLYWGGLTADLPLGAENSYTITFAITNPDSAQFGFYVDYDGADAAKSTGFVGNSAAIESVPVGNADDANGKRYYCLEIDAKGSLLNFYVLFGGEYQLVTSKQYEGLLSDRLGIIFYLLGGRNASAEANSVLASITVSDVNIYGGLYRGAANYDLAPEADGSLLLEVKDLQKDAFNVKSGAGYHQSVAQLNTAAFPESFYSYDAEKGVMNTTLLNQSKGYSIVYGGRTNLLLTETSKYTVSYYQTLTKAGGAGLRVSIGDSYADSIGVYLHQSVGTGGCLAWGANTGPGYSGYKKFTAPMMNGNTVYWQEEQYAKVDIEINGTVVSVYINDTLLLTEDITNPSNPSAKEDITKRFMSDTLCLVFHEYANADLTAGAPSTQFKDIRVYAGLLHQESYDVKTLQLQTGSAQEGKLNLRFVGGGMEATCNRVGFEITATYGGKTDTYDYNTPEGYRKLTAPRKDTTLAELTSADLGYEYLYGYTLYGVPADITVTFTVRAYTIDMGNRLYAEAVTFTVENGVLK
ncbi:MAG: hypothetical protein E7620_03905 [Ruminococcaceae bacterium]|nr:hypothetical protein [Oscillospiraceae bacterium]